MCDEAARNDKLCGDHCSNGRWNGALRDSGKKYPNRFFLMWGLRKNMRDICGRTCGRRMKPVFAVYSSFLQRAYDQMIHDVALQNLSVMFAVDRAGLVGNDGETHQGIFDLSYLSSIPNMVILSPKTNGN